MTYGDYLRAEIREHTAMLIQHENLSGNPHVSEAHRMTGDVMVRARKALIRVLESELHGQTRTR